MTSVGRATSDSICVTIQFCFDAEFMNVFMFQAKMALAS